MTFLRNGIFCLLSISLAKVWREVSQKSLMWLSVAAIFLMVRRNRSFMSWKSFEIKRRTKYQILKFTSIILLNFYEYNWTLMVDKMWYIGVPGEEAFKISNEMSGQRNFVSQIYLEIVKTIWLFKYLNHFKGRWSKKFLLQ